MAGVQIKFLTFSKSSGFTCVLIGYCETGQPQMADFEALKPLVGVSVVLGSMLMLKKLLRRKWYCQDKTVMITGASSGIGAALAR
jgi:hypothetical protein